MPHEVFTFNFWFHFACACIGSGLLYVLAGRSDINARALEGLLDGFGLSESWRFRWGAVLCGLVGGFVAMILAGPTTARQALSAGLGWTGFLGGVTVKSKGGARK